MKKYIILALLVLTGTYVFSQGKDIPGREPKGEWLVNFKRAVFYEGYLKGLHDSEVVKKLQSIDKSYYNPVFQQLHSKAINQAALHLVSLIEKDYKESHNNVAEPADGRKPMVICLEFYTSKTLDAMALAAYHTWMKDPNREKRIKAAQSVY